MKHLALNLSENPLDNSSYLSYIMTCMPKNLQHLTLNFEYKELGENYFKNIECLGYGMAYLPENLKHLELILKRNKCGRKEENIRRLVEGMK